MLPHDWLYSNTLWRHKMELGSYIYDNVVWHIWALVQCDKYHRNMKMGERPELEMSKVQNLDDTKFVYGGYIVPFCDISFLTSRKTKHWLHRTFVFTNLCSTKRIADYYLTWMMIFYTSMVQYSLHGLLRIIICIIFCGKISVFYSILIKN